MENAHANSGSAPPDFGEIDVQLNRSDSDEVEVTETVGAASNEQRFGPVPDVMNEPRELLSESTDLNTLLVAILGEDAREGAALERVAQSPPVDSPRRINQSPPAEQSLLVDHVQDLDESRPVEQQSGPVEQPQPASDTAVAWQRELETLLPERTPREVATVSPTPVTADAASISSGARFAAVTRLLAMLRRWRISRVSLLVLSALAGMTLGVWAWQSSRPDRVDESTAPRATTTAAAGTPTTVSDPVVPQKNMSTEAAAGSPAAPGGGAQARSTGVPRASNATAGSSRGTRATPSPPTVARGAASAPARRATSPATPVGPTEGETAQETDRAPESPPARTDIVKPQPASGVAPTATESTPASTSSAVSPAAPVTGGGTAAARPESPAVAPSVTAQPTEPRLVRRTTPEYPIHLRRAKVGGKVTVTMTVDAQGRVVNVRSISGPNLLRPAAEAAAQRWRYEPATLNGTPLESSVNVTFTFDPGDASQTSR
jgi:protein TonB